MRSLAALAVVVSLAGCGGLDYDETTAGDLYVHGYLYLQPDDERRLCQRMSESGACDGPSLVLANPHSGGAMAADGVLEHGCCAIGSWSPRQVAVQVWLHRDRSAHVLA